MFIFCTSSVLIIHCMKCTFEMKLLTHFKKKPSFFTCNLCIKSSLITIKINENFQGNEVKLEEKKTMFFYRNFSSKVIFGGKISLFLR